MKKTLLAFFILSMMISYVSLAQTTDTDCEFECRNDYSSAKFECSENWSEPDQQSNKDNCMNDVHFDFQNCMDTCISE